MGSFAWQRLGINSVSDIQLKYSETPRGKRRDNGQDKFSLIVTAAGRPARQRRLQCELALMWLPTGLLPISARISDFALQNSILPIFNSLDLDDALI